MTREPEFFSYDNGVTRNRLGLDDAEALSLIERDLTFNRTLEIGNGTAPEATCSGQFDLEHLRAIHRHIFQDVYEWAGTTRNQVMTVEGQQVRAAPLIYKDDGRLPVPFLLSTQVDRSLNETFARLREHNLLQGLPRTEFADRAAVVFSEINQAHPFMEGNGRTQREFMTQLAVQAGHSLNFAVVSAERMSVVSLEARMGDVSGMQRLFQEISDSDRVAVLERAVAYLDEVQPPDAKWDGIYVATMTPGHEYSGSLAGKGQDFFVMASEGDVFVGHPQDLPEGHGRTVTVQATPFPSVSEGPQPRLEHGLDY